MTRRGMAIARLDRRRRAFNETMSYRDDLDALRARHAALDNEVAENVRRRDDVRRMVDEATARAKLPVLANIEIASPCKASWDEMTGDERTRLCGLCDRQVFNLSELTRDEAETLIADRAGKLCARYYKRADGTILLADCTIGRATVRKRRRIALASSALLAAGAGMAAIAAKIMEAGADDGAASVEIHVEPDPGHVQITETTNDSTIDPLIDALRLRDQLSVTAGVVSRVTFDADDKRLIELRAQADEATAKVKQAQREAKLAADKVRAAELAKQTQE